MDDHGAAVGYKMGVIPGETDMGISIAGSHFFHDLIISQVFFELIKPPYVVYDLF
jgi:hypothetical protein